MSAIRNCAIAGSCSNKQHGGALLMAMVIVALVATFATSMVWMQWRAVQVESAERRLAQMQWILRGFLDFGRIILREDTFSSNQGVDHLGESWAIPLQEISIASFLAVDKENPGDAPDGFLAGEILDASARYHLYNLFTRNEKTERYELDIEQMLVLKRLCGFADVSTAVADQIATNLFGALRYDEFNGFQAEGTDTPSPVLDDRYLLPQSLDQLIWFGIDASTIERLRPFLIIFPFFSSTDEDSLVKSLPVNINTASREVLAAVVPGLDLATADRLIQARQKAHFVRVSDMQSVVGNLNLEKIQKNLSTKSRYFELHGRMRLDDRVLHEKRIVERDDGGNVLALVDNTAFVEDSPNLNNK